MAHTKALLVCFDHHASDGRVWAIRYGRRWLRCRHVILTGTWRSEYAGPTARQPRARFVGRGTLRRITGAIVVQSELCYTCPQ